MRCGDREYQLRFKEIGAVGFFIAPVRPNTQTWRCENPEAFLASWISQPEVMNQRRKKEMITSTTKKELARMPIRFRSLIVWL